MPILTYENLDAVPEDLREAAKTNDAGKVTVNVVPVAKLDSFRDNNIQLSKERDQLREELGIYKPLVGELTPEDFKNRQTELEAMAQRVKDGELKEGRQIEEALAKRTEELRRSYDDRLQSEGKEKAAWIKKHEQLYNEYKTSQVSAYIKDACMDTASGVEPKAVNEIVSVALKTFKADDQGRIIPYEGDATIYGQDGSTPMNGREWLTKLKEDKPFFFKQTNGGGAGSTTEKKTLGRTPEQMKKLSASELLALANGEKVVQR